MKVEKAIEIVTQIERFSSYPFLPDDKDALRLLIETGRFRQRWEQQEGEADFPLLPGETKD